MGKAICKELGKTSAIVLAGRNPAKLETAKAEVLKPFPREEELKAKTARLDELNILLNMDKKENEIVGGEPDEGEAVGGRKEKSYER